MLLLQRSGLRPVLVHGGGPEITRALERLGIEPKFVDGLRVTDADTMEVVEMVLAGRVNKRLVTMIQESGGRAVGLSGKDAFLLKARPHPRRSDRPGGSHGLAHPSVEGHRSVGRRKTRTSTLR